MKKIFCLIMCLALTLSLLALVACNNNGDAGASSSGAVESSDSATGSSKYDGTESTSGTSDVTGDSINDSDVTEDSTEKSDAVSDESDADTTDSGTNESDGETTETSANEGEDDGTDSKPTDKEEMVTVQFRPRNPHAEVVSGQKMIEILKGTELTLDMAPTFALNGCSFAGWSFNPAGTELWNGEGFAVNDDLILYATWESANSGDEDDSAEKITVEFVCFMYEPVSGETKIKIDKGSVLLPEQMPVYERKGYVMVWSYDRFGEEKWQPTDVFENDTELYGTWQAENLFDELKAKLSGLTNFQMNSAVDTTMGDDKFTHITVNKYDGEKVYMEINAEGMVERVWYVDGACYMEIEGKIVEQEMSRAEFDAAFGSEVVGEDSFFGIKKDWVKSIKREGIEYTIELDAEKYTESKASDIPVELVYSSVKFIFTLDVQGKNLSSIRNIYSFTQDGVPVTGDTQSEILNIGTTVVEAPVKE